MTSFVNIDAHTATPNLFVIAPAEDTPVLLRLTAALLLLATPALAAKPADAPQACVAPGLWADASGRTAERDAVLARAARAPAVLLGERHDSAEQHRWQLQVLNQIYGRNPHLAVGLEMIPRAKQPALDRWVEGKLSEADFLREVDWRTVWGFDPQLYLPILHFARMNRVPLVAINVEQALVRRTGKEGWAAVPESEREGVGTAAPPSEAYLDYLAEVLGQHEEDKAAERNSERFRRFVEAQSVWDRAMAERIADTHRRTGRTVVTIVGAGHVQSRFGIPHQLADLGIADSVVLLPWEADRPCKELDGKIADAVFGIDTGAEPSGGPPKPKLGVMMEKAEGGATVKDVIPGSVADGAGLKTGDVVTVAAGRPVRGPNDVIEAVQRAAPGTWLPMTVKRGGKSKDLVAKFPVE